MAFAKQKTEGERCDRRLWRRQGSRASGSGRNSVSELRTKNFGHRNRSCHSKTVTRVHPFPCSTVPQRTARIPQSFCRAKCQPPFQGGLLRYCAAAKRLPLKFQGGTFASAACGLRATAAGGGDKGAKKLGSRLPWRKRSEAGRLSGNPEEPASKKEWQRSKFCERIANKEFRAPQQEVSQQNRD